MSEAERRGPHLDAVLDLVVRQHDALRHEVRALRAHCRRGGDAREAAPPELCSLLDALEGHLDKEDLILLPALRAGRSHLIERSIAGAQRDHDDQRASIQTLQAWLREGRRATPLRQRLEGFFEALQQLTRLEDEILFAQALHND